MNDYDDNYSTCAETSASFRIKHISLDPATITEVLGLTPSWGGKKGETWDGLSRPARFGLWAIDSANNVQSRDLRRHLDWILEHLKGKEIAITNLRSQGHIMDVFCNWARLGGTGGPTISPQNMLGLSNLGLELAFEFWVVDEEVEQ